MTGHVDSNVACFSRPTTNVGLIDHGLPIVESMIQNQYVLDWVDSIMDSMSPRSMAFVVFNSVAVHIFLMISGA